MSDEIGYCDFCRHSRKLEVYDVLESLTMECRRYPPSIVSNSFPKVSNLIWCGEYEPKRKIGEEPNAKVSG